AQGGQPVDVGADVVAFHHVFGRGGAEAVDADTPHGVARNDVARRLGRPPNRIAARVVDAHAEDIGHGDLAGDVGADVVVFDVVAAAVPNGNARTSRETVDHHALDSAAASVQLQPVSRPGAAHQLNARLARGIPAVNDD